MDLTVFKPERFEFERHFRTLSPSQVCRSSSQFPSSAPTSRPEGSIWSPFHKSFNITKHPSLAAVPLNLVRRYRFDDGTLGILETLLISKDVRSSIDVRSSLKQFMRIESLYTLREIAHRTVAQKLSVLEFFVKAFALIGDFEARILYPSSCLIYISTEPGLSDQYYDDSQVLIKFHYPELQCRLLCKNFTRSVNIFPLLRSCYEKIWLTASYNCVTWHVFRFAWLWDMRHFCCVSSSPLVITGYRLTTWNGSLLLSTP